MIGRPAACVTAVLFNSDIFLSVLELLALSDHFRCDLVCKEWHLTTSPLLEKERWTIEHLIDTLPKDSLVSRDDFANLESLESACPLVLSRQLNEAELRHLLHRCGRARSIRFRMEDAYSHFLLKELAVHHPDIDPFNRLEALVVPAFEQSYMLTSFGRGLPRLLMSNVVHLHFGRPRCPDFELPTHVPRDNSTNLEDIPVAGDSDVMAEQAIPEVVNEAVEFDSDDDLEGHEIRDIPRAYSTRSTDTVYIWADSIQTIDSLRILTDDIVWTWKQLLMPFSVPGAIGQITRYNRYLRSLALPSSPDAETVLMLSSLQQLEELQLGYPSAKARVEQVQSVNEGNHSQIVAVYLPYLKKLHCFGHGISATTTSKLGLRFVLKQLTELVQQYPVSAIGQISIPLMLEHLCDSYKGTSQLTRIDVRHDLLLPNWDVGNSLDDPETTKQTDKLEGTESDHVLRPLCLEPLITYCVRLEHLSVHLPRHCEVMLDDEVILRLACGCPLLRVLSLCPAQSSRTETSPQSLINLVLHAQYLNVLHLGLSTRTIHDLPNPRDLRNTYGWSLRPSSLKELDLGAPKVKDPNVAVTFLQEYFPKVTTFNSTPPESLEVYKTDREKWEMVMQRVAAANAAELSRAVIAPKLPEASQTVVDSDSDDDEDWAAYDPDDSEEEGYAFSD